jgi:murein DD-endopeptidase MepM/ murein hydrolase activator NlpD
MQYARGDLRYFEVWTLPEASKSARAGRRGPTRQSLKFEPLLPIGDRPMFIAERAIDKPTRARRVRNWFFAWFRKETRALILLNAGLSAAVLAFSLPLAPLGFVEIASPILLAEASLQPFRISAYAGIALFCVAALTAAHAHIFRRRQPVRRTLAALVAIALAAGGAWLLAVSFYAGNMPNLFKPGTALAASALVAQLDYYNISVAPLILPGLAMAAAFLLSAKQVKSAIAAWRGRGRKFFALAGLATSLSALAVGAYAGEARQLGVDLGLVAPPDRNITDAGVFSPPFAAGVPCHVSDNFGERRNPFDPSHYEFHPGVDIGVAAGTPVNAMASGTVLFAGESGGYGNMVAIEVGAGGDHPTTLVLGHMQRLYVQRGDLVSSGDVIGVAGSTGRSTGPHLHLQVCSDARVTRFGAFVCGTAQNPYEMWHTLSAIARASCTHGPTVSSTDLVSWNSRTGWSSETEAVAARLP